MSDVSDGDVRLSTSFGIHGGDGTTQLPATAGTGLDGETSMGRSIDTATTTVITWRPLMYDPLLCRICAMSNGPNALAKPTP